MSWITNNLLERVIEAIEYQSNLVREQNEKLKEIVERLDDLDNSVRSLDDR